MLKRYLLYPLSLLLIRRLAGYDSRYRRGKAFPINNRVLRAILMDRHRLFEPTPARSAISRNHRAPLPPAPLDIPPRLCYND